MIIDYLENIALYKNSCPHIEKAADLIRKVEKKEKGIYEAEEIHGIVQEITPVLLSEKNFEAHIKYIDIHYIIEGIEVIDWQTKSALNPIDEYNEVKDIRWYDGVGMPVTLTEGMFCITYPSDGHKTGCYICDPVKLRKIVIKIPVE